MERRAVPWAVEFDDEYLCSSSFVEDGDGDGDGDHHSFSSTGYLEDVLFEFSSKRRRLNHTSITNCWTTSNLIENFNGATFTSKCDTVSESKEALILENNYNENENENENEKSGSSTSSLSLLSISSSSSHKESPHNVNLQWTPQKTNLYCTLDTIFPIPIPIPIPIPSAGVRNDKKKKRVVAKVVYPFALVKPGGFEGDATLNDINERILMPPTRPVRHPVGDFACRPLVLPDGPGLSGKAVVAFTRIQTQGRGTITIIRTRD